MGGAKHMKTVVWAMIALGLLVAPCAAAPLEIYGRRPAMDQVEISPEGSRLAFVAEIGAGQRVVVRDVATKTFIAAVSGLAPLAFGGAVFQSAQVDLAIPVLGELHLVTSTIFDIGVYLVVVGLVLDLLRALGSRIDRQILRDERAAEGVAS